MAMRLAGDDDSGPMRYILIGIVVIVAIVAVIFVLGIFKGSGAEVPVATTTTTLDVAGAIAGAQSDLDSSLDSVDSALSDQPDLSQGVTDLGNSLSG